MKGINKAIILGHLGRDPEIRYTGSGTAIANFSVATSEKWKDKQTGEDKEATEWHRVVCFGRSAEVAGEYLKKGSLVYVEGKIKTRKWEQDGIDRYTTEIVVDGFGTSFQMLGGTPTGQGNKRPQGAKQKTSKQPEPGGYPEPGLDWDEDDIPF